MDILLLERLAPEALVWLQERHRVAMRLELAGDAAGLRRELYDVQSVVLPRKVVVTRDFLAFAPMLRACTAAPTTPTSKPAATTPRNTGFDALASGPAPLEARSGPIDTDPAGLSPGA